MAYKSAIVLVTGGTSGIGRAFVDRFVAEGATVYTCGRDPDRLEALRKAWPSVSVFPCDVANTVEMQELVARIGGAHGRLDVLVNNAGVMERIDLLHDTVDDRRITEEIAINLTAPILLTRRCLPLLQAAPSALVVMVTSGYALLPSRRAPTYSATKAGLHSFTMALRHQLKGTPVRVVEVLPPVVDTPRTASVPGRKMSPAKLVDETVRGIERGRTEVLPGQVRFLPMLMRAFPHLAARIVAES